MHVPAYLNQKAAPICPGSGFSL